MTTFEDDRGTLWIGTFGEGLDRFDRATGLFEHFRHVPDDPASLSGDRITSIAGAVDGRLWVGTDGGGLNLFDPRSGKSRRYSHEQNRRESLPSDVVYALFVDAAGGLWVGTRAGLSFLPPRSESFRTYTSRQGLANDVIYGIRSDEAGRLWLSTNNGLSMFEPRRGTFKNYRASHGLQANEFNFGASYRSPTGELFFGGNNGFNGFFPERLAHNETAPPVVLTRVTKNYSPLDGPADQVSRVHLEFRDRIIVFEFAALDYTAPDRNRIAYKLEGFDQDWVETDSRQATYTQLKAGRYVFRVRGANNDGVWNQNGLSVAVDVDAAPWATPWAWGAYLLVGCGCVAGAVRSQQRKVARQVAYGHLLEQRVQERTLELQKANEELAKASITDSLTGLANRRFLSEYVEKEISLLHRRYREIDRHGITQESLDIGFMMIDLDNFKSINDSSGHSAGDEVLRQLRDILRECCRESDIVIRWGGDEFLIVARDTDLRADGRAGGPHPPPPFRARVRHRRCPDGAHDLLDRLRLLPVQPPVSRCAQLGTGHQRGGSRAVRGQGQRPQRLGRNLRERRHPGRRSLCGDFKLRGKPGRRRETQHPDQPGRTANRLVNARQSPFMPVAQAEPSSSVRVPDGACANRWLVRTPARVREFFLPNNVDPRMSAQLATPSG